MRAWRNFENETGHKVATLRQRGRHKDARAVVLLR